MADHVGRRRLRRARTPPLVLDNPPPRVIPEEVHTSSFKGSNPNSGEKLRDAPPGVPLEERTIYKLTRKYKSETSAIATFKNGEIIGLLNECGDSRCESYKLQAISHQTRNRIKAIAKLNEQAKALATKAQTISAEVEALGEKAVKVPTFMLTYPVLP